MSEHGGDLYRAIEAYGIDRSRWIDLSTGVNPNGYEIKQLPQSCFHHLPDQQELVALEDCARACYGVKATTGIIAAPGSEFLINALPQIRSRSKVAVLSPTFVSHEAAWRRYGHQVRTIDSIESVDDDTVVVMVNPNNPDGMVTKPGRFKTLAEKLHQQGGLLVIDEAFIDSTPKVSFVSGHDFENVIVLRSIGKFYGTPGVRLGFAIGPTRYLEKLRDILGAWAVSGPAIEVGRQVLSDQNWAQRTRDLLEIQKNKHLEVYKAAGLKVIGGTSLFHLIEMDDARTLHVELAKRGVWTRIFDYDKRWMRLGLCKSQDELSKFASLLDEALQSIDVAA